LLKGVWICSFLQLPESSEMQGFQWTQQQHYQPSWKLKQLASPQLKTLLMTSGRELKQIKWWGWAGRKIQAVSYTNSFTLCPQSPRTLAKLQLQLLWQRDWFEDLLVHFHQIWQTGQSVPREVAQSNIWIYLCMVLGRHPVVVLFYWPTTHSSKQWLDLAWRHGASSTSIVKGITYTTKATTLITSKGMWEPFIASTLPSSSQTAEVFLCLACQSML